MRAFLILPHPRFRYRRRPGEVTMYVSEAVSSSTSKEAHDLRTCREHGALFARLPEVSRPCQPCSNGRAPPAVRDATCHPPPAQQNHRGAQQDTGPHHAEVWEVRNWQPGLSFTYFYSVCNSPWCKRQFLFRPQLFTLPVKHVQALIILLLKDRLLWHSEHLKSMRSWILQSIKHLAALFLTWLQLTLLFIQTVHLLFLQLIIWTSGQNKSEELLAKIEDRNAKNNSICVSLSSFFLLF